jgi:hypothetical protein
LRPAYFSHGCPTIYGGRFEIRSIANKNRDRTCIMELLKPLAIVIAMNPPEADDMGTSLALNTGTAQLAVRENFGRQTSHSRAVGDLALRHSKSLVLREPSIRE